MKILVTGASGFIGSFVVQEALDRDFHVWAAVRHSSSREYLGDARINFIELDFSDEARLTEQLRPYSFDYVVHAAGVTKSSNVDDFYNINSEGTRRLVAAILALGMPLKKFVYLSSLSVYGPIRDSYPHLDILLSDNPRPNTHYGKSKLMAENHLRAVRDRLNYTILRPTGVYGPREKDYFMMVKSIKRHADLSVGFSQQDITFVYISALVQAVFLALEQKASGGKYFITDGEVYTSSDFCELVSAELGNPWCTHLTVPVWAMSLACSVGEWWGKSTGRVTALNRDKFNILRQRNWRCDVGAAMTDLGYSPKVKLSEGVKLTIDWYKANGWI